MGKEGTHAEGSAQQLTIHGNFRWCFTSPLAARLAPVTAPLRCPCGLSQPRSVPLSRRLLLLRRLRCVLPAPCAAALASGLARLRKGLPGGRGGGRGQTRGPGPRGFASRREETPDSLGGQAGEGTARRPWELRRALARSQPCSAVWTQPPAPEPGPRCASRPVASPPAVNGLRSLHLSAPFPGTHALSPLRTSPRSI